MAKKAQNFELKQGRIVGLAVLALKDIEVDEAWNSRQERDKEEDEALATDIQERGLLTPLTVAKRGKGYFLVAGYRRFTACSMLNKTHVQCTIVEDDDLENRLTNVAENVSRNEVSVWDLGRACKEIMRRHKLSGADLAKRLGYNRNHINYAIKLQELPDQIVKEAYAMNPKPPQSVMRKLCYNCDDDAVKQLEMWEAFKDSQSGDGGAVTNGAKTPGKSKIKDMLANAREWKRSDEEKYSAEYLQGVDRALSWALGMRKQAPLTQAPELEEEEAAE